MKILKIYGNNIEKMKNYCRIYLKNHNISNKNDFIDEVIQDGYIKLYNWINNPNYKEANITDEENYVFPFILKSTILNHLTIANQKGFKSKEVMYEQNEWLELNDSLIYDQGIEEEIDRNILLEMIQNMSDNEILAFQLNNEGYKDYEVKEILQTKSNGNARKMASIGKKKINTKLKDI